MKKKIIFVSHCLINTASKVLNFSDGSMKKEDEVRKKFLLKAIENDIHIIQLPCPEFTLYGPLRWGHVKDQFNNIFFRNHCVEILKPFIEQMNAYVECSDLFEVAGIVGINGSPSCGVDYTCIGDWCGEISSRENFKDVIGTIKSVNEKGVMMEVLSEMLEKEGLKLKIVGLDKNNPSAIFDLIGVECCGD